MDNRKEFHIPSSDELDKSYTQSTKRPVASLFHSHQQTIRENIQQSQLTASSKTTAAIAPAGSTTHTMLHIDQQEHRKPSIRTDELSTSNPEKGVKDVAGDQTHTSGPPESSESSLQNSESSGPGVPSKAGKGNALVVSNKQRGNPVLKHIRNVGWEFGDIVPDYQMGLTNCALFLSLRYHSLNPNYIHQRLKQLGHSYTLRVVLVQVDEKDPHHALQELASICILADCTLILAFTAEEAGRYLETYKAFENKPPDLIMEKTEGNYLGRFTDVLTAARRVNKTDAATLISKFGTFENLTKASEEDLSLCPGFGPQKAQRVFSVLREPFLKSKKRPTGQNADKESTKTKKKKVPTATLR